MIVDYLKNHPHHLRTVVDWVYNEWWKYRKGCSFREVLKIYSGFLNDNSLPIALIALQGSKPVGSALICEFDPDIKIKVSPWLEELFVKEDYRGKGIGRELVKHIEQIASGFGYKQLFLSTHVDRYYENMGWVKVRKLRNNDTLMQFDLQETLCGTPVVK